MNRGRFEREQQYTNKYNIFNAMRCPDLIGSYKNVLHDPASTTIGKVANNIQDYVVTYPISGYNDLPISGYTDSLDDHTPGKTIEEPLKGPFYDGPDSALGSNYFMKMGKCSSDSSDGCGGKDRYVFVRNIPTGSVLDFYGLTGCNLKGFTEFRGLLPGIMEDLGDMLTFNSASAGEAGSVGGNYCKKVTQKVGKNVNDPLMK